MWQARPSQALQHGLVGLLAWLKFGEARAKPSGPALSSLFFFVGKIRITCQKQKTYPSCKQSGTFFSCDHHVLHVTTKMALKLSGSERIPKATTQKKVFEAAWILIDNLLHLCSLFVKTSIISSSVFIILLMYTPESHLCHASNIF
jgi:hypothetical protein